MKVSALLLGALCLAVDTAAAPQTLRGANDDASEVSQIAAELQKQLGVSSAVGVEGSEGICGVDCEGIFHFNSCKCKRVNKCAREMYMKSGERGEFKYRLGEMVRSLTPPKNVWGEKFQFDHCDNEHLALFRTILANTCSEEWKGEVPERWTHLENCMTLVHRLAYTPLLEMNREVASDAADKFATRFLAEAVGLKYSYRMFDEEDGYGTDYVDHMDVMAYLAWEGEGKNKTPALQAVQHYAAEWLKERRISQIVKRKEDGPRINESVGQRAGFIQRRIGEERRKQEGGK